MTADTEEIKQKPISIEAIINQIIEENGFLEVDKFINICLYDENFGYYKNKNPFGLKGDFVTSPQMTSLFGEMIALYIGSYFNKINPQKLTIIELGGGNGFFMRDCLSLLKKFPNIYQNIDIIMVESSDLLIKEQKTVLKPFLNELNISWLKDLYEIHDNLDSGSSVFIFSNEFFDAFPIKQFIKIDDKWREVVVKKSGDEQVDLQNALKYYDFAHNPKIDFSNQVEEYLSASSLNEDVDDESIVEISIEAIKAFEYLCSIVAKQKGQILTIDYGYLKPTLQSSLKAVLNHKEVDVLTYLGQADITYLVNFTALHNISSKAELLSYGIITQRDFLTSIGIEKRLEMFISSQEKKLQSTTSEQEIEKIKSKIHLAKLAVERIISKTQMGDLFKVHICEST